MSLCGFISVNDFVELKNTHISGIMSLHRRFLPRDHSLNNWRYCTKRIWDTCQGAKMQFFDNNLGELGEDLGMFLGGV